MNPDLRNRSILIALLLTAWAALIYAKSVLPEFVLADLNSLISYIQVLLGGIVGYHVGAAPTALPSQPTQQDMGQGGFVRLPLLAVIAVLALLLSGCAGIFGHTSYQVTRAAGGCEFSAQDGKEFASRNISFDGKDCTLIVEEGASKAFRGQAIGAKTLTVLPVTGLDNIVK